jgi:hypothetical protein
MSVWKPTSVENEPSTRMVRYVIYRAYFDETKEEYSDHIVGYCYEGRVSSKIVEWDSEKRLATTRSGRKYHLTEGGVGVNMDALYVWGHWKYNNNVIEAIDVTEEYVKDDVNDSDF